MTSPLRIALYAAIIGLVLALIGGILASVNFGTIVLRMILSAGIAAILGAGLAIIVQNYLPELSASKERSDAAEPEESTGENVDIVVDDNFDRAAREDKMNDRDAEAPVPMSTTASEEGQERKINESSSELPILHGGTFSDNSENETSSGNTLADHSPRGSARVGTDDDPRIIARAIQTILKRE